MMAYPTTVFYLYCKTAKKVFGLARMPDYFACVKRHLQIGAKVVGLHLTMCVPCYRILMAAYGWAVVMA